MKQRIIDLIFILSLIGTVYFGGYVMYQINTVDYKAVIGGSK
jgi:hypothetical protein